MNILAIGAHPDDLEIFAYGFLAAAAARFGKASTMKLIKDAASILH